ncbi:TMEM175 family protein [Kitasatospora sp. NPDC059571]|uniref:TMEM175 family protein n=1 Tax=Kitasatospora sp. NPDC059571 TaxID=3346871 RepID=UPI00367E3B93
MRSPYHRIAGSSLERLAALSDGIFAVAMTLLVLDLHLPKVELPSGGGPLWTAESLHAEQQLWTALLPLAPRVLVYLLGFLTLGMFWVGQQTQLNHFDRSDRQLTWIHLAFLLAVALMPFSTSLLAEYTALRIALLVYWLHLLLLGGLLLAGLRYAARAGLIRAGEEGAPGMQAAAERRIVVAQALYAVAVLLGVISTYLSVGLIILLQLNSALAPRIRPLDRY